nr:hypothetical protein [Actinoplanes sp. ATCC 53533]
MPEVEFTQPSAEVASANFPDTKSYDASLVRIPPASCVEGYSPHAGIKTVMKTVKMFPLEYRIEHCQGGNPERPQVVFYIPYAMTYSTIILADR